MKYNILSSILIISLLFNFSLPVHASSEYKVDESMIKMVLENNDNVIELYDEINSIETIELEDNKTENNLSLYGCICWVDNLGVSNEIQYVSGNRTGSYSGDGTYTVTGGSTPLGSGTFSSSFYDSNCNGQAMVFRLRINSYDSSGNKVTLAVATSIID